MAVKTNIVYKLLSKLSDETGTDLDYGGFGIMSEKIDADISQKYLDDTYRLVRLALAENKETIGSRPRKLDLIARHLGYRNFHAFEFEINTPIDPMLKQCIGNWWSIVHANTGKNLYKAPVRIYMDRQQNISIKLKGQENIFIGKISLRAGCFFCELDSGKTKKLYLVIKCSVNEKVKVLQGTFAGISSTGDPIGGRELLMKEDKLSFEDMKWQQLSIGGKDLDPRVAHYFRQYESNAVKIDNQIDLG